jgi:hypothetical protein
MGEVNIQRRYAAWQRRAAALLFVLQAVTGTAVSMAHAAETSGGPVTLETHHTAQCVILHDPARCAQCQFDVTRMSSPVSRRTPLPGITGRRLPGWPAAPGALARIRSSSAHSRAPPLPLS